MGRYKRKKHVYSANTTNNGSETNGEAKEGGDFNSRQKLRIREYLTEYRDGARRIHDESCPPTNSKFAQQEASIAEITLPKLTQEILEQPYLSLPADLAFRQRQYVHDCCIDRK